MAANNVISVGELQACERYGFLHYSVFGRANLAAATYDGERPSGARKSWPDEFVMGRRNDYELARANLDKEALNQLDNLVIFRKLPALAETATAAPQRRPPRQAPPRRHPQTCRGHGLRAVYILKGYVTP